MKWHVSAYTRSTDHSTRNRLSLPKRANRCWIRGFMLLLTTTTEKKMVSMVHTSAPHRARPSSTIARLHGPIYHTSSIYLFLQWQTIWLKWMPFLCASNVTKPTKLHCRMVEVFRLYFCSVCHVLSHERCGQSSPSMMMTRQHIHLHSKWNGQHFEMAFDTRRLPGVASVGVGVVFACQQHTTFSCNYPGPAQKCNTNMHLIF